MSLTQQCLPVSETTTPCTLPLPLQKVPAGFPSPAADCGEYALDINDYLVLHRAASFYFTVAGDSMCGAGIFDGDKVLVDRSVEARHGHIVVAVVNGEYTLKRFYWHGGTLELRAENPSYAPIRFSEGAELRIWGVVVGMVRKYRV